jgi:2-octaprenylphenol hydroxylase
VTALVATVNTKKSHDKVARQVFLKTGPLAFLPLNDEHYCSIVWSLPSNLATDYMQLTDHDFNMRLTNAISFYLGDVSLVDHRYAFPLMKQQTKSYIADHIALVGDAAHVVHPLAGQGINLGLLDVNALCDTIVSAILHKRDIASFLTLRRYERAAKSATLLMMKTIDGIHHLFVEGNARYAMGREMGVRLLESCNELKKQVMRAASGVNLNRT